MRKLSALALFFIIIIGIGIVGFTQSKQAAAPTDTAGMPGVPFVVQGLEYRIQIGIEMGEFKVVGIRKDGIVIVWPVGRSSSLGGVWQINLKQALLVELKPRD
jgi:hypothetical protein